MPTRSGLHLRRACLVILLSASFSVPAIAGPPSNSAAFSNNSPNLFGDWDGDRTQLANDGVFLFFNYDGQAVHNVSGGNRHLTRLANQWVFGASLDFDKLVNWKGASFDIIVTNRSGRDLNADAQLGTNNGVVNDFGIAETWWLTEFAFDQKFFDGRVDWRIGRTPAGTDFNKTDLCDFMNLVYCGTPFTDVTSYSTFFNMGRWGTRVKFLTTGNDYFAIGMYQVNPKYYDRIWAVRYGLSLRIPSGTTGWMFPIQYGWDSKIGEMPGTYQVGVWYSTAPVADLSFDINHNLLGLTGLSPLMRQSGYGAYLDVDQRLTDDGSGKGFSLFLNVVQSNPQTEAIDQEINVGFKYHHPFNRPDDYVGVGLGSYRNNHRAYKTYVEENDTDYDVASQAFVGHGDEYHFEAFYSWSVLKSIQLLPDVQYIAQPSGASRNKNVFTVGLTTKISF